MADAFSRSLTSSQSAARRSAFSTMSSRFFFWPFSRARRRCCRRSTSGTGSASGTPCRCVAPRPGRSARRRGRPRGSDRALHPGRGDEVVHAVEATQHGGLAAAGRADERGDLVLVHVEVHLPHGAEAPVVDAEVVDVEHHLAGGRSAERWASAVVAVRGGAAGTEMVESVTWDSSSSGEGSSGGTSGVRCASWPHGSRPGGPGP